MKKNKKYMRFKFYDLLIIFAGIIFAIFFLFPTVSNNKTLYLIVDEERTKLSWEDSLINLQNEYGKAMSVEVDNGKARIVSSDCPDKICIRTGWISSCGEIAACVPNSVAIMVLCDE